MTRLPLLRRVRHTLDVAAPPEAVWGVLGDFDRYVEWSPWIAGIRGTLAVGEVIEERIRSPFGGSAVRGARVRLLRVAPPHELQWLLAVPLLLELHHAFVLQPAREGTRVVHTETLSGLLAAAAGVWFSQVTEPRIRAFDEALKARVEGG